MVSAATLPLGLNPVSPELETDRLTVAIRLAKEYFACYEITHRRTLVAIHLETMTLGFHTRHATN